MRNKRRKKLKREWEEFQSRHQLTDADIKLARQTGYPVKRFEDLLGDDEAGNEISKSKQIKELHLQWSDRVAKNQADIAAGVIEPKKKKPAARLQHDPKWAKAKEVCRLNMDDIRKAKELGLSPQALIRNVPSPSQKWKAPVKVWIQDLYEKRIVSRGKSTKSTSPLTGDSIHSLEANVAKVRMDPE